MNLLLDTHLLIWSASSPKRLPVEVRQKINNSDNEPMFSVASLWEIAIKRGLGRDDFQVDPARLRRGLLDNGYSEIVITAAHTIATQTLPPIHKDPFDRMLIAQAMVEGVLLITADPLVAQYPGVELLGQSQ